MNEGAEQREYLSDCLAEAETKIEHLKAENRRLQAALDRRTWERDRVFVEHVDLVSRGDWSYREEAIASVIRQMRLPDLLCEKMQDGTVKDMCAVALATHDAEQEQEQKP